VSLELFFPVYPGWDYADTLKPDLDHIIAESIKSIPIVKSQGSLFEQVITWII